MKAQRAALVAYTEAPVRQGGPENPWEGLVAGVVMGEAEDARALLRAAAGNPGGQGRSIREASIESRPEWGQIVREAEGILGRRWAEMAERYGDWGRDGTMAVATRELGWRLVEVVRTVGGIGYAAAAQGVGRFWRQAEQRPEMRRFAEQLQRALNPDR